MEIKFKLDGKPYRIDPDDLTLGEGRFMRLEYGLEDYSELNVFSTEHLAGLAYCAVRRSDPEMDEPQVRSLAEAVKSGEVFADIHKQMEKAVAEAEKKAAMTPQKPVVSDTAAGKNGAGGSGTTRKPGGSRRSPASTT